MYVCMYVCMYICMYMYMYIYSFLYLYLYTDTHVHDSQCYLVDMYMWTSPCCIWPGNLQQNAHNSYRADAHASSRVRS